MNIFNAALDNVQIRKHEMMPLIANVCKELNIDTLKKREVYKTINKTGALDPASLFKHPEVRPGVSTRSGSNPD